MPSKKQQTMPKPEAGPKSPGQMRQSAIKNAKGVGQALKIAASNDGNIGTKEFKNIQKAFGKRADQVVGRIDKLNEKFGSEYGSIGLKGNTANRFAKGGFGNARDLMWNTLAGEFSTRPKGQLANALYGMNDTYSPMRQGQGGYKNEGYGKAPKNAAVWGFANNAPLYREAKSGTGAYSGGWSQFAPSLTTASTVGDTAAAQTTAANTTASVDTAPVDQLPVEDPMAQQGIFGGGYGEGIYSNASGFKSNRSSRKRAGSQAQGYNSMTITPQVAQGVGINYG